MPVYRLNGSKANIFNYIEENRAKTKQPKNRMLCCTHTHTVLVDWNVAYSTFDNIIANLLQ